MIQKLVLGIICSYFLFSDFSKSKSGNYKAKIFHFISTLFIIIYHSNAINDLSRMFIHYHQMRSDLTKNLDEIDSLVNIINYSIYLFACIFLFLFGIGLINRSNDSRIYVVNLVLYFIPSTAINIYIISKKEGHTNAGMYFLLGLMGATIVYGSISLIYSRKYMIDFFNEKDEK